MIPATTDRVVSRTDAETNKAIERATYLNVRTYAQASPQAIDQRLCELDHEWDTDRLLGLISPLLTLLGLALGAWVHYGWLALSAVGAASLLVYSLTGWFPGLFLFRQAGLRASTEIACEKYALKALRGDFQKLDTVITPEDREALANLENEGGIVTAPRLPEAGDPHVVGAAIRAVQK